MEPIGVQLPSELEAAIGQTIQNGVKQAVDDTRRANHWPAYMNQRQAATYLGTSAGTLIKWEKANIGFPTIMIEGSKHYSKRAIDRWMDAQQSKK